MSPVSMLISFPPGTCEILRRVFMSSRAPSLASSFSIDMDSDSASLNTYYFFLSSALSNTGTCEPACTCSHTYMVNKCKTILISFLKKNIRAQKWPYFFFLVDLIYVYFRCLSECVQMWAESTAMLPHMSSEDRRA